MNCRELSEAASDYLEGALPSSDRRRLADHLRGCAHCRAHLDQLENTIRAARRLQEPELSPQTHHNLMAVFRRWHDETRSRAVSELSPGRRLWALMVEGRHLKLALRWALVATPILAAINHGVCVAVGHFNAGCVAMSVASGLVPFAVALYLSAAGERAVRQV